MQTNGTKPRRTSSVPGQWVGTLIVTLPLLGLSAGAGWRAFAWAAGL